MPRFLLVPDSFKGTLSSQTICDSMEKVLLEQFPEAEVIAVPAADGGEGSSEAFLKAAGGEKIKLNVTGPDGNKVDAFYAMLPDKTAVIEMAAAAGLPLMGEKLDVLGATTYGVGELMADALARGARKMILCLGGSATHDGGCGAAAALGIVFRNKNGEVLVPAGGTLTEVAEVDFGGRNPLIKDCEISVMCDIDNPLCGPEGAAAVFAPQKGASEEDILLLDRGLRHLSGLLGTEVRDLPGAGAAGGFGGGAVLFFGGRLKPGIEMLLDAADFDEKLKTADLVFTGEGRLDRQSLRGKVISGVAKRTKRMGKPLIAVVGDADDDISPIYELGVTSVFSINRQAIPFSEAKHKSRDNLEAVMRDIAHTLRIQLSDMDNRPS